MLPRSERKGTKSGCGIWIPVSDGRFKTDFHIKIKKVLLTLLFGDRLKMISEYRLLVFIFPNFCKWTALLAATSTWKLFTICNSRNRKVQMKPWIISPAWFPVVSYRLIRFILKILTIVGFIKAALIWPATALCLNSAAFLTSLKSICVTLWSEKSSSWWVKCILLDILYLFKVYRNCKPGAAWKPARMWGNNNTVTPQRGSSSGPV